MRLAKLVIDNYRVFTNFEIAFEEFTVTIGRNNAGKTSLVHALELLLHPGSDQTLPINRDDFREQDKDILIEGVFDQLDSVDTQAFFSLQGSPSVDQVGILLEARWKDGEIVSERYITRPDKKGKGRKIEAFTRRYSQFLAFSYISPYRQPEQATRLSRGSDYRSIMSLYAGDFIQPIEALVSQVRILNREIREEVLQRGSPNMPEYDAASGVLDDILCFMQSCPITDPTIAATEDTRDSLSALQTRWRKVGAECLTALQGAVASANSAITTDICDSYSNLVAKVLKLLQRCEVQFSLLDLRTVLMDSDDFVLMQQSLSSVLHLLLPEMPPSLQPFPIQDDRLLNEVRVQLGDSDLLYTGSGYQSTFAIGLRVARILAEASKGVKPRLLLIALEEPEAHLHPHKQRHVVSAIQQLQRTVLTQYGLNVQIVFTTHSSNILAGLSPEQVIILRTSMGSVASTKLERERFLEDWLDQMNVSGTDRRMRTKKLIARWVRAFFNQYSEALFARFTLIVEGDSEIGALPVWAARLPEPNNLDQLGISVIVGGGSELTHVARLLESLKIDYLLVCDRGDDHDLSGIDPSRVQLTIHANFEEEILAVLPLHKVLTAVEATLTDEEVDGLCKYLKSPKGIPAFSAAGDWQQIVAIAQQGLLSNDELEKLKHILQDHEIGRKQKRHLLKGADVGTLLANEVESLEEIPPVYFSALTRAQGKAMEIMASE